MATDALALIGGLDGDGCEVDGGYALVEQAHAMGREEDVSNDPSINLGHKRKFGIEGAVLAFQRNDGWFAGPVAEGTGIECCDCRVVADMLWTDDHVCEFSYTSTNPFFLMLHIDSVDVQHEKILFYLSDGHVRDIGEGTIQKSGGLVDVSLGYHEGRQHTQGVCADVVEQQAVLQRRF